MTTTILDTALSPGSYKVLYVYTINDQDHQGRLKIGDATYHTSKTLEEIRAEATVVDGDLISSPEIESAARARIDEQTKTADVKYELLFTALSIRSSSVPGRYEAFRDYQVHEVLLRSGFSKRFIRQDKNAGEWFEVSLNNAIEAFKAVQGRKSFIDNMDEKPLQIVLRPEQKRAVAETLQVFRSGTVERPQKFLWNAIMRFGKTLTSYSLVQSMPDVSKVLIITHRPVVAAGWSEDFRKMYGAKSDWQFGAKQNLYGVSWDSLDHEKPFYYFASIQDLRGSFGVNDEANKDSVEIENIFEKNAQLFSTQFDLIIVDEGHEGTKTPIAERLVNSLQGRYWLYLSGTPFNIIDEFDDKVFNWDYIDEQRASERWELARKQWDELGEHAPVPYPGEVNPYGMLPKIEIRHYDILDTLKNPDVADAFENGKINFSFAKFFEIDKNRSVQGRVYDSFSPFKNPRDVAKLLNLIFYNDEYEDDHKLFPFSRNNSKVDFAHTFWMLPSVDTCVALHEMLAAQHPEFAVVNATGDNDGGDALLAVKEAIRKNERTITLSAQKLTTGTTVPEWTAVFMLSNMASPLQYMQTIFRVKSVGSLADGRQKEVGYVFDFAPDRSLKMLEKTAASIAQKNRNKDDGESSVLGDMLTYMPIISYDGARFVKHDVDSLLQELRRVFIAETVSSGFTHRKLFDLNIHDITKEQAKELEDIRQALNINSSKKEISIAASKLTRKGKRILLLEGDESVTSADVNNAYESKAEDQQNAQLILETLRAVASRLPLLIFASEAKEPLTVDNFATHIDDASWDEFMPQGFTRNMWDVVKAYFDVDVFNGACAKMREQVLDLDACDPLERAAHLTQLFASFRNPDRETVLTPWAVVNRHMGNAFNGIRFVDDTNNWYCSDSNAYSWDDVVSSQGMLKPEPQWNHTGDDEYDVLWGQDNTTFFDPSSKTGLYPLYAALNMFMHEVQKSGKTVCEMDSIAQRKLWKQIVENGVFVNCRSQQGRAIAQRVLAGCKDYDLNITVVDMVEIQRSLRCAEVSTNTGVKRKLSEEEMRRLMAWVLKPSQGATV